MHLLPSSPNRYTIVTIAGCNAGPHFLFLAAIRRLRSFPMMYEEYLSEVLINAETFC